MKGSMFQILYLINDVIKFCMWKHSISNALGESKSKSTIYHFQGPSIFEKLERLQT